MTKGEEASISIILNNTTITPQKHLYTAATVIA